MRERGFTLIETTIAMALLTFIVADVGMVAMYASRSGGQARRVSAAVSLAENAIEHVRGVDFSRIRLADTAMAGCLTAARNPVACGDLSAWIVRECFAITLEQVDCGAAGTFFTREREVTTLPDPLPDPLPNPLPAGPALDDALGAKVAVLVTWLDDRGGSQEFRLASIVSKY